MLSVQNAFRRYIPTTLLVGVVTFTVLQVAYGQDTGASQSSDSPLAPFVRLVGGQWHSEGNVQEFEWGVGKQSVRSRGFRLVGDSLVLVAEGLWFWHPGHGEIRGLFTAQNMPFVMLEYRTRFEGQDMINDIRAYDARGRVQTYAERWKFIDHDHYEWTLTETNAGGVKTVMSATFERR